MDKELNIYQMVIYIKDSMQMGNQKVKENTPGIQVAIIMEPLSMDWDMVKELGLRIKMLSNLIVMRVNMWMIKNVDSVFIDGNQVVDMKEISLKIWDMVLGRCIGMMDHIIVVCGKKEIKVEKENMYIIILITLV